jgi:DNA-binding response OmpR family regulator
MTAASIAHHRPPTNPRSAVRLSILLADDDPATADLFAMLFAADPIEVLTAADGRAALQLWRDHHPDLLLLDTCMPHANGFEVCRQVRAVDPHTPIVLLSAAHDLATIGRGYDLGADIYLVKPILDYRPIRLQLLALLRRARHHRRQGEQLHHALTQLAQHITREVERCGAPSQHLTQAQLIVKHLERLTTETHD